MGWGEPHTPAERPTPLGWWVISGILLLVLFIVVLFLVAP